MAKHALSTRLWHWVNALAITVLAVTGYVSTTAGQTIDQPASAITGVTLAFSVLPVVLVALSLPAGACVADALRASGVVARHGLDEATLHKWLENPKALVPGNRMSFPGIKDAAKRAIDAGRTRYTAVARHRSAEAAKTHSDMGFHDGWGTVATQLEAYAQGLMR